MAKWMIRKPTRRAYVIEGLFSEKEIQSKIENAELDGDAELCFEKGYWFRVSESEELKKNLGIEKPAGLRMVDINEEATKPDMEVLKSRQIAPKVAVETSRIWGVIIVLIGIVAGLVVLWVFKRLKS